MPKLRPVATVGFESHICRALADPTGMTILCALTQGARCINERADLLRSPEPTLSRHLRVLHDALLVDATRHGQNVVYTLSDQHICQVIELLRNVSCDVIVKSARDFGALPRRKKSKNILS
jgi:DNA-binding transcriptional ArsR family regulator